MQARLHSREAPITIVIFVRPSVCLSACISVAPTGRISVKFVIDVLYQNLSGNYKFGSDWARISDTLHEDLSTFHCCWRHTFAVKRCCAALRAKISDTLHEDLSTFHCCWRRTFAVKRCCAALSNFYSVHTDINSTIHGERIVAFPLQQLLHERAKMLCYAQIVCLVNYYSYEI